MGCDIHIVVERCLRKPDAATRRARVLCLILAKRAASEPAPTEALAAQGQEEACPFHLPQELWLKVARQCPVTLGAEVEKWVRCPYTEWLVTSAMMWPTLHTESQVRYADAVARAKEEALRGARAMLGEDLSQEEFEDSDEWWEFESGVEEAALASAAPASYQPATYSQATGYVVGHGGWDDDVPMARRSYNAFGLISAHVR